MKIFASIILFFFAFTAIGQDPYEEEYIDEPQNIENPPQYDEGAREEIRDQDPYDNPPADDPYGDNSSDPYQDNNGDDYQQNPEYADPQRPSKTEPKPPPTNSPSDIDYGEAPSAPVDPDY